MTTLLQEHAEHPISRLPVPEPEALAGDIRKVVEAHHQENWVRSLSVNGETVNRFAGYFESLFSPRGRLPLRERELIAVIVSATNGCGLCTIHHTRALGEVIEDHARAQRIALDDHLVPLSRRERALVDLARKITLSPKSVGEDDFARLRDAGLSDADILEAVETSAWFNHTNRIFISLGVVPDDKFFPA
ncbi:hypothetical protein LMIY3S_00401 [Labrys miyagiensis]